MISWHVKDQIGLISHVLVISKQKITLQKSKNTEKILLPGKNKNTMKDIIRVSKTIMNHTSSSVLFGSDIPTTLLVSLYQHPIFQFEIKLTTNIRKSTQNQTKN